MADTDVPQASFPGLNDLDERTLRVRRRGKKVFETDLLEEPLSTKAR